MDIFRERLTNNKIIFDNTISTHLIGPEPKNIPIKDKCPDLLEEEFDQIGLKRSLQTFVDKCNRDFQEIS